MKTMQEIVEEAKQIMPQTFLEKVQGIVSESQGALFKIPILGGMKAGKSTLLSKVLSCESAFLPPDVLEATARTVRIRYGFAASREIIHADGSDTPVDSDENWSAYVRGKADLSSQDDVLEVKLPDSFLRETGAVVCDTPGNNSVDGVKAEETWGAISGAQVALYCIRATSMLSKSDVDFLITALPQLKNFIFVVTRIDEAGIGDASSAQAKELVEYVRERLRKTFPVEPLAVVATSSRLEGELSGVPALKELIVQTLRQKGTMLREAKIASALRELAEVVAARVENDLSLIKKADEEGAEEFAAKIGAFKSRLVEVEAEKTAAIRRLNVELANKKTRVKSEIAQASRAAVDRAKRRAESLTSAKALEDASAGILLSEADLWRQDVQNALTRFASDGNEILSAAAGDFLARLQQDAKRDLNIDFKIVLSDPGQYEVSEDRNRSLAEYENLRQSTLREIEALEQEMSAESEKIPEIQRNLMAVKEQLAAIGEYKPQYTERTITDNSAESTLSAVGEIIDWALLLVPIPMGKLQWLNKFKYAKQIKSVIKSANKAIRMKNTFFKNVGKSVPGMGSFLDALSVEHWTRKLGQVIDAGNARTVIEEDQDVKTAYQQQIAPFIEQEQIAQASLARIQDTLKAKEGLLLAQKAQAQFASDVAANLEREIAEQRKMLADEKERELLFAGRRQFVARATALFLCAQSELTLPVMQQLETVFAQCGGELSKQLAARMDATLADLRNQIEQTETLQRQDVSKVKENVDNLSAQLAFLETLTQEDVA